MGFRFLLPNQKQKQKQLSHEGYGLDPCCLPADFIYNCSASVLPSSSTSSCNSSNYRSSGSSSICIRNYSWSYRNKCHSSWCCSSRSFFSCCGCGRSSSSSCSSWSSSRNWSYSSPISSSISSWNSSRFGSCVSSSTCIHPCHYTSCWRSSCSWSYWRKISSCSCPPKQPIRINTPLLPSRYIYFPLVPLMK